MKITDIKLDKEPGLFVGLHWSLCELTGNIAMNRMCFLKAFSCSDCWKAQWQK
jgi:hypothetical protein